MRGIERTAANVKRHRSPRDSDIAYGAHRHDRPTVRGTPPTVPDSRGIHSRTATSRRGTPSDSNAASRSVAICCGTDRCTPTSRIAISHPRYCDRRRGPIATSGSTDMIEMADQSRRSVGTGAKYETLRRTLGSIHRDKFFSFNAIFKNISKCQNARRKYFKIYIFYFRRRHSNRTTSKHSKADA